MEFLRRGQLTIAVDFDGTICRSQYPHLGNPVPGAAQALRHLKRRGHALVLFTCREGGPLTAAKNWLNEHGLLDLFSAVNANTEEMQLRCHGDPRKVAADVYLDDKALNAPIINGLFHWPLAVALIDRLSKAERRKIR